MGNENWYEKGQMLLLVIVTMTIALTVGLSLASRTITNIKISKQNEESERAFQAAEAGIETSIKSLASTSSPVTFSNTSGSGANYSTIVNLSGNSTSTLLNNGNPVTQDAGINLWLSTYPSYTSPTSPTLSIYWGSSGQTCAGTGANLLPALEILVLSGPTGYSLTNPTVSKYFYDFCSARNSGTNSGSINAGSTKNGVAFSYFVTLPAISNGYLAEIIPLYDSTVLDVESNVALPPQGNVIQSTGKSGDSVRKIIYYSPYPQIPVELFSYAIISQ